jgi:hypothetical protein
MRKLFFIPTLFICALYGCESKRLSQNQYTEYISDESNGLTKSVDVGNTTVGVSYRPTDLWVSQEVGNSPTTEGKINDVRKKYSSNLYFILSLATGNKEALHQSAGQQYSDLLQTLSFRMNEYASLTTSSNDTIQVGDFILNRTYGMSGSTDILFVFNKDKATDSNWVQFNLNEFGLGIGNQRFRFDTNDIENCPQMEFAIN